MLAIEAPKPGTVIHWHISDILNRESGDMGSVTSSLETCSRCGTTESTYIDRVVFESDSPCPDSAHDWVYGGTLEDRWRHLLAQKREDWHYRDMVASISEAGIHTHLGAILNPSHLYLVNGHHRVAAAVELGIETVPVFVYESMSEVPF